MPEFSALGWAGLILIIVGLVIVLITAYGRRPGIAESDNPIDRIITWLIELIERGIRDPRLLGWALMAFGAILLIADVLIADQASDNGTSPSSLPPDSPPPSPEA